MAEIVIKTVRLKRGTAEAWSRVNPILLDGEPGYERDTNRIKVGNGSTAWNDLPYIMGDFSIGADGNTITYNLETASMELYGYADAAVGQIPSKGEHSIEWIDKEETSSISEEDILDICTTRKE